MAVFDQLVRSIPRPGLLHGRYAISERAGRESACSLYRGVDVRNGNRPVLIGEIGPANGDLTWEAALLGSLRHPHLPRICDVFRDRGSAYLVMDAIEGKPLLQLLRENGGRPLPVPVVLEYARQLCDVLVYLARRDPPIPVRDLRPSSVWVSGDGRLYLVDPSIADFPQPGQQQEDITLPAPGRALRNQRGTSSSSPRSALSGLGLILRSCLTGEVPSRVAQSASVPVLYRYNYQVPVELDRLIQRLVTIDERQPQLSVLEVQQMLMRIGLQADEHTIAVTGPHDRTQDGQAARPPVGSGGEAESDTLPVNTRLPAPAAGHTLSRTPTGHASRSSSTARVWTHRFVALSALALALLLGSSLYALVFVSGSAHFVEFGLSIALLIAAVASASSIPPRSLLPWALLLPVALLSLLIGLAFLVLATPAAQRLMGDFLQVTSLEQGITYGLVGAALVSLAWLARSFDWRNRLSLLIVFAAAALCAIFQYVMGDATALRQTMRSEARQKHFLLVIALLLLLWGVVAAARMERVREREKAGE